MRGVIGVEILLEVGADIGFEEFFEFVDGRGCGWCFEDLNDPWSAVAGAVCGVHAEVVEAGGCGDDKGGFAIDLAGDAVADNGAVLVSEKDADGGGAAFEGDVEDGDEDGAAAAGFAREGCAPEGFD